MDDGGNGGISADMGALGGPNTAPDDGNCIVVHPHDNAGIFLDPDGYSFVVLPRQPTRLEDELSGDPDAPDDDPPVPS